MEPTGSTFSALSSALMLFPLSPTRFPSIVAFVTIGPESRQMTRQKQRLRISTNTMTSLDLDELNYAIHPLIHSLVRSALPRFFSSVTGWKRRSDATSPPSGQARQDQSNPANMVSNHTEFIDNVLQSVSGTVVPTRWLRNRNGNRSLCGSLVRYSMQVCIVQCLNDPPLAGCNLRAG